MKTIAYMLDGVLVTEGFSKDTTVDFNHIDITNMIFENIDCCYIEDGEIKIDQEKLAQFNRNSLPPLTKRQFSLYLFDIGKYDQVMDALNANPRFKIEFETVATIERNSPTVIAMGQILEWDDLTIDEKWQEALLI